MAFIVPRAACNRERRPESIEDGDAHIMDERTYHVIGVPLRTGSLYPGNENDAQAYREAGLVARLAAAGCRAVDGGDVAIPSYVPHHKVPPIRSWPGPRIAWDAIAEHIEPHLREAGQVPFLIGCDCSVVLATAQALRRVSTDVHLLYVDGDLDDAAPDAESCRSAAAVALWLLTHPSPFWAGPPLDPSQVTVIGASGASESGAPGPRVLTLADVRAAGPAKAARKTLEAVPASASIVLHLDIDVFREPDLPAAYFPHDDGLTRSEGAELLAILLGDPRVRVFEVAEYAALRDRDRRHVRTLVEMFASALGR
jgi:arginase